MKKAQTIPTTKNEYTQSEFNKVAEKYLVTDEDGLYDAIKKEGRDDLLNKIRNTTSKNRADYIAGACLAAQDKLTAITFEERAEAILEGDYNKYAIAKGKHIWKFIRMVLYLNIGDGDKINTTLKTWCQILRQKNGKQNAIYLLGNASTGKSTLIHFLSSIWKEDQVGTATKDNSQFWLQNLIGKKLSVFDEVTMRSSAINEFKLILEGNKNIKSDVKHSTHKKINPQPIIIASNVLVWAKEKREHQSALEKRCHMTQF